MLINFQTYFYDGSNIIAPDVQLEILVNYPTGALTRNILLNNNSKVVELVDNNGIGVQTTFSYDSSIGRLTLTADTLLPNNSIELDVIITSNVDPASIHLNLKLYDVILDETIYIITSPEHIKASTMVMQKPLTNTVEFYNLTNSTITTCEIKDGDGNILSSSSTGVITLYTSAVFNTKYTYTYYNGTTFITVEDSSTIVYNHNSFLPTTDTSFTNDGFLYKGFPTINTKFNAQIISNYTNINIFPQTNRIMKHNVVGYNISDVTGGTVLDEYMSAPVDNNTMVLPFTFDEITGLNVKDYIVNLTNYIITNISTEPVVADILISGNYYYVAAIKDCSSITDGTNTIPITPELTFYIDPAVFGTIGTSIAFSDVNGMTVLQVIPIANAILNQPYYITDGEAILNGVTYPVKSTIFLNENDVIDPTSTAKLLLLDMVDFYNDRYNVTVYDSIAITHPECNKYEVLNNSLTSKTIDIYQLIYTVDIQGEYQKINTVTISSGDKYIFVPSTDGVYKFDFIDSNDDKTLFIVSTCNVDNCLIKYINDLVCCNNDDNCECNLQGHDCMYIDRSNFIATSLLYDLLKNMIIDVIGIDQIYSDTISDDALYLHSISDILTRISNFCNDCDV